MNSAMAQCPVPVITPSGPVDLCTGGSVTLTATAGASYVWSTGATTQAILVSTPGSYSVTVDDGLGCIETSATTNVTLNSNIPGGINNYLGSNVACPGESHIYSVNPTLRAVYYEWTCPTGATIGGVSTFQTTSTSVTVDFDAGFVSSGILQVAAYNGCGVRGPVNKTISPSAPGTPVSITGPSETCANTTYTFSTPLVTGVISYNWTIPPGAIIVGQGSNQVDITFPLGYITNYVVVRNQNSCGISPPRSLYTRSTPPKPGAITGPISGLCNTTQTYSISPVATATSYTWYPPVGCTVVSGQGTTTADILFASNLNNGYVRVSADNSCGSSPKSKLRVDGEVVITDDPDSADLCVGVMHTLTVFAPGGGLLYQWRKDGINLVDGGTISGVNTADLTIDSVALSDAGLYDCVVGSICYTPDTSAIALITVMARPDMPGPIVGDTVACSGYTGIPYSITPIANATSYLWVGNQGVTFATGQGTPAVTINFGATTNSGYAIEVRGINQCGSGPTNAQWARSSISTPVFTTSSSINCAGTSGVPFEVSPVTGAINYTWTAPFNATVSSGQGTSSATVDFGPSFSSGKVCVTAHNICMSTPLRCENVVSTPATPGAIGGTNSNLCNTSQVFFINNVFGATQYNWTAPSGATVSSGQGTNTATIDFGPSFSTGIISVTSENTCGTSLLRNKGATAFPARPAVINGDAAPCANSSGNVYSISSLPGATSYIWSVPPGSNITSGASSTSITVTFGNTAGNITARGVNACGIGSAKGLTIAFSCRLQPDYSNENSVGIYPNPANEKLNIIHPEGVSGLVSIRITDVAGRTLLQESKLIGPDSNESSVSIGNLSSGIFLVEFTSNAGVYVNRFVKN